MKLHQAVLLKMVKNIFFLYMLFSLSYQSVYAQYFPNFCGHKKYYSQLKELNKKLKIKSRAKIIFYKNEYFDCSVNGFKIQEYQYDAEGNITEINQFVFDKGRSRISDKFIFTYEGTGNIIKYTYGKFEENYVYDNDGNLKKLIDKHENVIWSITEYTLDNNRIVKSKTKNDKNETIREEEYFYDEVGNLILIKHTSKYSKYCETKFAYDKNDNLISEYSTNAQSPTFYNYDEDNRIIKGYTFDSKRGGDVREKYIYEYND